MHLPARHFATAILAFASLSVIAAPTGSPFSTALLEDESLWGDGQAEYNFYDATEVRYDAPRKSEVRHILVRENFLPNTKVKADDWKTPGAYPVFKLNQIIQVPTGVYRYDQMHSAFWNADTGKLEKFSLASMDSCGNSYKEGRIARNRLTYDANTYWEKMDRVHREVNIPETALFYDELPFKLRLLDWDNVTKFTAPLTKSVINSKADVLAFEPAKFTVESTDEAKRVTVEHVGGTDTFEFEPESPYTLRLWNKADGGRLQYRGGGRLDYWNHNAPGDEKWIEEVTE
ncbi:MAG: hypothetical protein WA771_08155 [Chthoniobacterales bacterium]